MSSLSVHLRQADDHSVLRFHPGCPICRRERLAGSLADDEIVSPRTKAAIAAGLLAFSTSGASVAAAAVPDEVIDGTSEVVSGDPALDIDFEPQGAAEVLPDAPPEPEEEPPEDAAPVDALNAEPESAEAEIVDDVATTAPASDPVAVSTPADPSAAPTPSAEAAPVVVVDTTRASGPKAERAVRRAERPKPTSAEAPAPVATAPAPAPAASTPAAPATARVVVGAGTEPAAPGARFHVVQRGESLWSIAADRLGDGAGVDRVAREVGRLWELNAERIGTGSPDLVYAGTRLRVR